MLLTFEKFARTGSQADIMNEWRPGLLGTEKMYYAHKREDAVVLIVTSFSSLCFFYAFFVEAAALRSIVLRYAGAPIARRYRFR